MIYVGLIFQAIIPTAFFYLCFYAEASLFARQNLALWASLENSRTAWLPNLFLRVGTCPACAGWWLGSVVVLANPWWPSTGILWLDMWVASLFCVVTVPIIWDWMSAALIAQRELVGEEETEELEDIDWLSEETPTTFGGENNGSAV
jgi:hypothetical protein